MKLGNILIYFVSAILLFLIFYKVTGTTDLFNTLSLMGIFATFGSALLGATVIYEQKSEQRVKSNVYIYYKDLHASEPWTRWGFLHRNRTFKLLNKAKNTMVLDNPNISFDVGSHVFEVSLPTVAEDFFDLPVFKHYRTMMKYDKAFQTKQYRAITEGNNDNDVRGMGEILKYQCVKDTLKHACIYRIACYIRHLSIGLIICSVLSLLFLMFN